MTSSCVAAGKNVFPLLSHACVLGWSAEYLASFSLEQLGRLQPSAWSAVGGAGFAAVVGRYGGAAVDVLSLEQLSVPRENAASDFVRLVAPSAQYAVVPGASTTWLQLAFVQTLRSGGAIGAVQPAQLQGLRPSVPLAGLALTPAQWGQLNCLTLDAAPASLLAAIPLQSLLWPRINRSAHFSAFDLESSWVPLWSANPAIAKTYFCPSLLAMPSAYFARLLELVNGTVASERYTHWRSVGQCPPPDPLLDIPCSGWRRPLLIGAPPETTAPPTTASMTPATTGVPTSTYVLVGVAAAAVAAGIVAIVVVVVVRRRRRGHSIVYTPLNDMVGSGDLDLSTW
jgi:hypothetical protein